MWRCGDGDGDGDALEMELGDDITAMQEGWNGDMGPIDCIVKS